MKGYEKYIKDILSGKIVSSIYIKQAVERFLRFKNREDIYFDDKAVDDCIEFISQMKHYLGKCAGQSFVLLPWQEFLVANIVGLKWKATGYRVCREVYLQMARKQGKTALIAALSLYFLIADGEASPSIACLATSRDQARLCFEMCQNFGKSLDPKGEALKYFRNYLKFPSNNGEVKVFSSDSSKLDGLNVSLGILDEFAAQKDNLLYSVIKSSQAMRTQPLLLEITTPQFSLDSPAYQTYQMSIEILAGIKEQDDFFCFLYTLDPEDDWDDEKAWVKSNPSMGQTVTMDYLRAQVQAAKNDSTQEVPVKIKNIGIWCQSQTVWIPQTEIVKCMGNVNLDDYRGYQAFLAVDLSAVQDLTSLSLLIPNAIDGRKHIFYSWAWLPEDTYKTSENHELYRKFYEAGELTLTPGNVVDYDAVINKMNELREMFMIDSVFYDQWNATQWAIHCTELGYNLIPFSQSIGHYNNATKAMAKTILNKECLIQKSSLTLFCFGNAIIKRDWNGNEKVTKESNKNKVDVVISMTTALGGYYEENPETDFDIFII